MSEQSELEKQGMADVEKGLDTLEAAADVADVGRAELAAGAIAVHDAAQTFRQQAAFEEEG